jgi:hypothetical protein
MHPKITILNIFDCTQATFGNPVLGVSAFTAGFYSLRLVHNIDCLFAVKSGGKSMYRERCSFCSNSCMGDERCGVESGFE